MKLMVALTQQHVSVIDRIKIIMLKIILPKQIIIDVEDKYRKRVEEL